MANQDWADEELCIVTPIVPPPANSPDEVVRGGQKSGLGTNPYQGAPQTPTVPAATVQESRIKAETLALQMTQFVKVISKVFAAVDRQVKPDSQLQLDEITLSVAISGTGEVKLLGSGVEVAGSGAIELKFSRSSQPTYSTPSQEGT
jgi:hypothetical protein